MPGKMSVDPKNRMLVSYPTIGDLPATGIPGSVAIVEDDGSGASAFYFWDSNAVAWVTATAGLSWKTVKEEILLSDVASFSWDTGIDGNAQKLYRLTIRALGTFGEILLTLNNDSAANYIMQQLQALGSVAHVVNLTGRTGLRVAGANTTYTSILSAQTGVEREIIGMFGSDIFAGAGAATGVRSGGWDNTVDNIIRMDFTGVGGDILTNSLFILESLDI